MFTSPLRSFAAAALGWTCLLPAFAFGQTSSPPAPQFSGEARITAVEVAVAAKNATGAVASGLAIGDVRVTEEGKPQAVTGVASVGTGEGQIPWRLALYVDLTTTQAGTLLASAVNLAGQAKEIAALGSFEIWVADPAPEPWLSPTRDVELITNALARLAFEAEAKDEQNDLRRAVLKEAKPASGSPRPADSMPQAELVEGAVAEEVAIAERSRDNLLTWVAGETSSGPRALFLVGLGHELDPTAFYRKRLPEAAKGLAAVRLEGAATAFARTLAAYGWVVLPLEARDVLDTKTPGQAFDEFRRRGILGNDADNVAMLKTATVPIGRKPAGADREDGKELLTGGRAPLFITADETGGVVVEKGADLAREIAALGQRQLVTFEVARQLDGKLRPLAFDGKAGLSFQGPKWVRSATPEGVTEARIRRIVVGEAEVGDLALSAKLRSEDEVGTGWQILKLRLDLAAAGSRPPEPERATLRLTVARGGDGVRTSFQHEILTGQDLTGPSWTKDVPVEVGAGIDWVVVLVEDLASGIWGARDLEPN